MVKGVSLLRTWVSALVLHCLLSGKSLSAFMARPIVKFCRSSHIILSAGEKGFGGERGKISASKVRSLSKNAPGSGTKTLRLAANTFDKIYKLYGKPCAHDLYVRSPSNDAHLFWFVGKLARQIDPGRCVGSVVPTLQEAVLSHKRLILEYAQSLRPQNLGGPFSKCLEVWVADGNSEMEVVQNKICLFRRIALIHVKLPLMHVTGSTTDISVGFCVSDVGFNPEVYVGDEKNNGGLRVKRDENGFPIKPAYEIPNLK